MILRKTILRKMILKKTEMTTWKKRSSCKNDLSFWNMNEKMKILNKKNF
jgi:hypothetical protein